MTYVRLDVSIQAYLEQFQTDHVCFYEKEEFVRWSAERRETGTRKRGRRRKRWMDCVRDDGKVVDLSRVGDRRQWRAVSRRPDLPWGDKRDDDDDDIFVQKVFDVPPKQPFMIAPKSLKRLTQKFRTRVNLHTYIQYTILYININIFVFVSFAKHLSQKLHTGFQPNENLE